MQRYITALGPASHDHVAAGHWRTFSNPNFCNAFSASAPETQGSLGMRRNGERRDDRVTVGGERKLGEVEGGGPRRLPPRPKQAAPTIATIPLQGPRVKPYDIEVQRLKSVKHDKGVIELHLDALVTARPARDDPAGASRLQLPVEHARTLLILLKQQLAELDKLQPRSRRSGRA